MNGFVSHEREKFERMAREMQDKNRDLVHMDSKLRKVQELIKNSPVVQSRRVPLKDSTAHNENSSDEKVFYLDLLLVRVQVLLPVCSLVPYSNILCTRFIYANYASQVSVALYSINFYCTIHYKAWNAKMHK